MRLTRFMALPLVMGFLGCSSMSTTQKGAAIGGLGGAAAALRGLSSVVRSEREEVLLLETNSRATRKCSNNSKKRLTGKVLS
jgi:hypothetical protein